MATLLGKILADFTTALSTDIAVGGTTATLSSATDDDGVALPSGRYFFTIDGSNSSKEHISCDLVGTALTNIKSLSRQGVETTGVVRKHRIGASVSLTDFGHIKFINDLIGGATSLNSSAPLGYDGAPASLTGNQLATVTYVLGVVNGGAVTFDQQVISGQTAGENLTANDVVYYKEADSKWWKADANAITPSTQVQLGIALATVSANATVQVAISGPVSGFTGLTSGSKYYLSDTAGAISTTEGSNAVFIGWALSTSSVLLNTANKTLPVGILSASVNPENIISEDNISANTTDQSQTTQNGTVGVGEADATTKYNKIAQSFIPKKSKIKGVFLYKSADTGTFTGTVTVSLQADSSGSPSGSALATQTISNTDWLLKPTGEFELLFASEYTALVSGATYWIVVETSTSDNSNHPNIGTNTAGGYTNGSVKFKNTTDNWTAIATIDLYFKTIEGSTYQVPKTNSSGELVGFTKMPVVNVYTSTDTVLGGTTTQFDITNPSGSIFRYTYDGTGTDPSITSVSVPAGSSINVRGENFNSANNGVFLVLSSGTNYFEVINASGVAESNKTLGTGYISVGATTWSKPANLKYIKVQVQGAGGDGSGASSANDEIGGGGGSGGYSEKIIAASSLDQKEPVIVGGRNTSLTFAVAKGSGFSTSIYATGGTAGNETGQVGGTAGTATGGDINIDGQPGMYGSDSTIGADMNGMGAGASSYLGIGATSIGRNTSSDFNGTNASGYGAGGSGAINTNNAGNAKTGGQGKQGVVIVTEYY